ncbi:hypothetical protein FDH38_gp048 [Dinoroseobacter phage vB_DshS-R5C]|uniref:Uncharacterized protein n=1 Tax=Dinoroseobacter phage vB_DshS-R5C TaxID=1965368 RepID=A0A1V0DY65_9CAUD|nr:hypothetical protein FDH38_gp048 [Dinoroseobacter phage vB_DshS-R5C]ARB06102.1 hypothetical protein vBDshSR5C_48 [Dinoroseobacter phage vB_DshS-R5C]
MFDQFQEAMDHEFNAQFDDVRERFAATELDAYHEGYCDYCNACDEDGEEPLEFDAWKASLNTPRAAPSGWGAVALDDEIPF